MSCARLTLALLLLVFAGSCLAEPADRATCLILQSSQWVSQGEVMLSSCLSAVSRQVPRDSSEELRFGAWRNLLLAASTKALYRSEDEGSTWLPISANGEQARSAK